MDINLYYNAGGSIDPKIVTHIVEENSCASRSIKMYNNLNRMSWYATLISTCFFNNTSLILYLKFKNISQVFFFCLMRWIRYGYYIVKRVLRPIAYFVAQNKVLKEYEKLLNTYWLLFNELITLNTDSIDINNENTI